MTVPANRTDQHTGKVWRGGLPFTPAVVALVSRMELVDEYRQTLLRLQGSWDLFALLGQMSGIGAEIGQTRSNFQRLTETLLDSLARQLLDQRMHDMRGKAQVAIDILVRNLFERTADVGFLATDAQLRSFVESAAYADRDGAHQDAYAQQRDELQARFKAYVAKYSVYDDIVVMAPDGQILARLDDSVVLERSRHALIAATLKPGVPFVESFGTADLLGGRRGLLYSSAIQDTRGQALGILCLSFRFEDELQSIFARLLGDDTTSDTVLGLFNVDGAVITSSDRWQLPEGVLLAPSEPGRNGEADSPPSRPVLRLAGREYLRVQARSLGYQGYPGPGWQAQALVPVEYAFRLDDQADGDHAEEVSLARRLDTREIFDAELRGIPLQAQQIQLDLARSVWNGKLKGGTGTQAPAFVGAFLQEVSRTGMQIRDVFQEAIEKLQTGAIAAVLEAARFQASLAIDIMDRNLYERANDCRWWALTPTLVQALYEPSHTSFEQANDVLRHINGLYTVYTLLVLFDVEGRVVAVSDPEHRELQGTSLDAGMVQATLALRDSQQYHVSAHAENPLYGDRPTYVYTAALRSDHSRGNASNTAIGGIAVVFDGMPQFEAMLQDALPRDAGGQPLPGAVGLFVSRDGVIVASTDKRFSVGSTAPLASEVLHLPRAANTHHVVDIEGTLYAAGLAQSSGYREYLAAVPDSERDVAAVVLLRLGQPVVSVPAVKTEFSPALQRGSTAGTVLQEIASFTLGSQWFGLQSTEVEEVLGDIQIVALPKAPVQVQGLLKYREDIVPVLDLAALLLNDNLATRREGPLLLCRTAQGQRLALRVASLGSIFEVDTRQLSPWQPNPGAPALHLLSGRSGDTEAMLTVLTLEALWKSMSDPAQWAELSRIGEAMEEPDKASV